MNGVQTDFGVPPDYGYVTGPFTPFTPEPYITVDNLLGLNLNPGPLPRIRSILVQENVPQGTPLNP